MSTESPDYPPENAEVYAVHPLDSLRALLSALNESKSKWDTVIHQHDPVINADLLQCYVHSLTVMESALETAIDQEQTDQVKCTALQYVNAIFLRYRLGLAQVSEGTPILFVTQAIEAMSLRDTAQQMFDTITDPTVKERANVFLQNIIQGWKNMCEVSEKVFIKPWEAELKKPPAGPSTGLIQSGVSSIRKLFAKAFGGQGKGEGPTPC